ncbi:MAG: TonB-dependent receptor [Bacteroidota bacterium]
MSLKRLNSTLFLLVGLCTLCLGQQNLLDRKVTIDFHNVSVKEALTQLKKEVNCTINFRPSELPVHRRVTKSFEREKLSRVIKEIWGSEQLKLRASGNMISIKRLQNSPEKKPKGNLRGRIKDDKYEPLPGVAVQLKGTTIGEVTDSDGKFSIRELSVGSYTLVISSLGYQSQEKTIEVTAGKTIDLETSLRVSVNQLDEVVVVGKTESQVLSEQPIQITSINLAPIQNESAEVIKILDRTSGVRIRQFGGLGSPAIIQLNGLSGNAVRRYYDGVPLELLGGGVQLNNIPANAVERIDVYKGVMPVDVGTDALAGGINIVSKTIDQDFLEASYQFGSFNSHVGTLNIGKTIGSNAYISLQGFYNYSDNSYRIHAEQIVNNQNVEVEVDRFHDAHESSMIQGTFGLGDLTWADQLSYSIGYSQRQDETQHGVRLSNSPIGELTTENQALLQSLKYKKKLLDEKLAIDYSVHYARTHEQIDDSTTNRYDWFGNVVGTWSRGAEFLDEPSRRKGENTSWVHRINMGYSFHPNHVMKVSSFLSDQSVQGEDPLFEPTGSVLEDPNRNPSSLLRSISGVSYEAKWFDQKLETIVFGKYYYYQQETTNLNPNPNLAVEAGTFTFSDNETGYGLGLKYAFKEDIFLRASYERALRIPTDGEIFGDFTVIRPNFTLQPELSNNLNVGGFFKHYFNDDKYLSIEANSFFRDQTNLIRLQAVGNFPAQFINEAEVSAHGFELTVRADPLKDVSVTASYTSQSITKEGDRNSSNSNGIGSDIPNIPNQFLNTSIRYSGTSPFSKEDEWGIFSYYTFVDEFALIIQNQQNANPENIIPTQHQVDMGIKYDWSKTNLTVVLQINNVLNREVFDNFRVPKPGRNFNIKLSYSLY